MTKVELVNVVSQETEVKKKDVECVVNAVLDAVAGALKYSRQGYTAPTLGVLH